MAMYTLTDGLQKKGNNYMNGCIMCADTCIQILLFV